VKIYNSCDIETPLSHLPLMGGIKINKKVVIIKKKKAATSLLPASPFGSRFGKSRKMPTEHMNHTASQ